MEDSKFIAVSKRNFYRLQAEEDITQGLPPHPRHRQRTGNGRAQEKGRQIRRYFIECEKKLREEPPAHNPL